MPPRKIARKTTQPVPTPRKKKKNNGSVPEDGAMNVGEASEAEKREGHDEPSEPAPSETEKRRRLSAAASVIFYFLFIYLFTYLF